MSIENDAPQAEAAEQSPLSADDAVLALTEGQDQDQPAAPADDAADPEDPAIGDDDQTQADPAEEPAIEAPKSWGADDKAKFAELPRDVQELILARETDRDRATSKAVTEAGQARKQAEQEQQAIAQYRAHLDDLLPKALKTFGSRWDGIDWPALAQADPARYVQAKAQYDAELSEIQQVQSASQQAEALAHQNHVRSVAADLATVAPDLADPKEGAARLTALGEFLQKERGYTPADLKWASASDLQTAWEALQWRQLQAKTSAIPSKQPAPAPAPVRPGSRQAVNTPASTAARRFAQTGKQDDAIALIIEKGL